MPEIDEFLAEWTAADRTGDPAACLEPDTDEFGERGTCVVISHRGNGFHEEGNPR